MKKFFLGLIAAILLCAFSALLVYGITNFNKLSFNFKSPGVVSPGTSNSSNSAQIEKYQNEISILNENILELNTEIDSLNAKSKQFEKDIEQLNTQKSELELQIENLSADKTQNEKEIAQLNNQIATINQTITEKNEECQSLNNQINTLNALIAEKQSIIDYYENILLSFDFTFVLTDCNKPIDAKNVWYDGDNIYYSERDKQYVFDKTTKTWEDKTWDGSLWAVVGSCFYEIDGNLYSFGGSSAARLNKEAEKWETVTFSGIDGDCYGYNIWSDGEKIFHSYSNKHYVLNKETFTWEPTTFDGPASFYGQSIFEYDNRLFLTYGKIVYEYNKETNSFEASDLGFTTILGSSNTLSISTSNLFFSGENLYYFAQNFPAYRFDFVNNGWIEIANNLLPVGLYGGSWWTDGENYFFSTSNGLSYRQYKFVLLNKK